MFDEVLCFEAFGWFWLIGPETIDVDIVVLIVFLPCLLLVLAHESSKIMI